MQLKQKRDHKAEEDHNLDEDVEAKTEEHEARTREEFGSAGEAGGIVGEAKAERWRGFHISKVDCTFLEPRCCRERLRR